MTSGRTITLLTPPFFDYAAKERPTPPTPPFNYKNPDPDYNQTLIRYGDFVRQLGEQRGIPVADTNAPMAAAVAEGRKTDPKFALSQDGVHPSEMGHVIMAAAVLKTWNAPPPIHGAVMPWPLPEAARAVFRVSPLAASLEGKPDPALEAKSQTVLSLVQQRVDAWHQFWKGGWANKVSFVKRSDVPTDDEMAALVAKNNELDTLRMQAHDAAQP